jgi:Zn-dependent peptidase ImmA (M78 family)
MAEAGTSKAPPKPLSRAEVEQQAAEILRQHGLYSIPVNPVELANRNGIKVHNAKFSDEGLSGMVAKRGKDVTVLVNQSDAPFRKRFTIAHELGHHFLHLIGEDGEFVDSEVDLFRDSESPVSTDPARLAEIQANQFAAGLLMPSELVKQTFEKTRNLQDLARIFNVSEEAMAIRLSRLGLA